MTHDERCHHEIDWDRVARIAEDDTYLFDGSTPLGAFDDDEQAHLELMATLDMLANARTVEECRAALDRVDWWDSMYHHPDDRITILARGIRRDLARLEAAQREPRQVDVKPEMSLEEWLASERNVSEEAELAAILEEARARGRAMVEEGYSRVTMVVPSPRPHDTSEGSLFSGIVDDDDAR